MLLYYMVIYPIRQFLEICYISFEELTRSPGLSVIGLSFVVTLCCLPLYIIAEKWQEKQRMQEKELETGIKLIKTAFTGDERFMILSTFYRQHHYHPLMALRSSFGLLIQIPFFIAAYNFLSHLKALEGARFLFIANMGAPDALFRLGSFTVNVLPILMTAINCISGAVYTKGHGNIREKIQVYVSALIFLVLLYNSPAGLVLYWTMNNLLSLAKNVFYKLRHPARGLYALLAAISVVGIIMALFGMRHSRTGIRVLLAMLCLCVLAAPAIVKFIPRLMDAVLKDTPVNRKNRFAVFLISALSLACLTGLVIPSMLMESEPQEFCFIDSYTSPFPFLWITFFQAVGLYVFWPACFYLLFGTRTKNTLALAAAFFSFFAIINTFLFPRSYGPLDPDLDFMEAQYFSASIPSVLANTVFAVIVFAGTAVLLNKRPSVLIACATIMLTSLSCFSVRNVSVVGMAYGRMDPPRKLAPEPVYHLSRTGRNVLVFMQDKLFSPFIDEIFEEKPGLADHFDGFTFYPNTISMGPLTMLGVPGLFGGYSYTPAEINSRTDQTLQQKHNEAILSMPVTFMEAGFEATVSDMPYENYGKEPATDMYLGYPDINRVMAQGTYSDYWYQQNAVEKIPYISNSIKHNFIMFSIFKTVPPVLRKFVHHKHWWNSNGGKDDFSQFIDSYSCLLYFPELFDAGASRDTFTLIDNLATHEPVLLQYPDYVPVPGVSQFGDGVWAKNEYYNTDAGTMRCYAVFFDWLKENGLYDNTRIIIVSDHGAMIETGEFDNSTPPQYLKEHVTASLLVKDFDDRTPSPDGIHLHKDMTFMTNADTPAIATEGLIPDARNPFTGMPYAVENKEEYVKICHPQAESTRNRLHTQFAISNDDWYTVHGDIHDSGNWSQIFPFGR